MFASTSPMLTRTPSLPNARTERALDPASSANSRCWRPVQPDKVALRLGHEPAEVPQSGRDPVLLVHEALYPFYNLGVILQRHTYLLGDLGHAGRGGHAEVLREFRVRHAVAHPQPGEAVGLGEGPSTTTLGYLRYMAMPSTASSARTNSW